jgi:hypothetical protein
MNLKLICIDNQGEERFLSLGKEYIAFYYTPHMKIHRGGAYFIDADDGLHLTVEANRFITLEDWREQQIKSILE